MALYDFAGLDQVSSENFATEAFEWNGVSLDNELPGYRTLRVDQRHDVETTTESILINHRNRFKYKNYSMMNLTVLFVIEADNNFELNERITVLKNTLRGDDVPFKIADDGYVRNGTVTNFTIDEQSSVIQVTGSFVVKTMDAFKRTEPQENTTGNIYDPELIVDGKVNQLSFTNTTANTKPLVTIGENNLQFINPLPVNANVVIDFDNLRVYVNDNENLENLGWIDIKTPLSSVRVKNGTTFGVTNATNIKLTYTAEVL